jgi:hypothetical protein
MFIVELNQSFMVRFAERIMAPNCSTSSDAPPTRKPSMSRHDASATQLFDLTEPPYSMRTLSATSALALCLMRLRMSACVVCAISGVAVLPVPMAQTGSYASTIRDQSSAGFDSNRWCSCVSTTRIVSLFIRSCSRSPANRRKRREHRDD